MFAAGSYDQSWNHRIASSTHLSSPSVFLVSNSTLCVIALDSRSSVVVARYLEFDVWFGSIVEKRKSVVVPQLKALASASQLTEEMLLLCDFNLCVVWNAQNQSIQSSFAVSKSPFLFAVNATLVLSYCEEKSGLQVNLNERMACFANLSIVSLSAALVKETLLFVVFESTNKTLFSALVDLFSMTLAKEIVLFGVGSKPSVAILADKQLTVSASDSFCWNSEFQNKETILFCQSTVQSQPGVLSYWKGPKSKMKKKKS